MSRVDLNADVGEAFGVYSVGNDAALMKVITSANVAAGFHAGDPVVLRETIKLARAHGVAIGAHPGLPDLVGFGRREMHVTPREAEDLVLYQIAAVSGVAGADGSAIQHVKPHGALFNMAAVDADLARAIARATARISPSLILFGPPRSALLEAGREMGLRVAAEVFADRAYNRDGTLVSRRAAGAVITDDEEVVKRAIQMVRQHTVQAVDGSLLQLDVDTICVHGDTPGADRLAARVRTGLETAGIIVRAVGADDDAPIRRR